MDLSLLLGDSELCLKFLQYFVLSVDVLQSTDYLSLLPLQVLS